MQYLVHNIKFFLNVILFQFKRIYKFLINGINFRLFIIIYFLNKSEING